LDGAASRLSRERTKTIVFIRAIEIGRAPRRSTQEPSANSRTPTRVRVDGACLTNSWF
jgi:hypothetical protein